MGVRLDRCRVGASDLTPPPLQPSQLLEELVFGHLQHCGYSQAARTAARDMFGGERQVPSVPPPLFGAGVFRCVAAQPSVCAQPLLAPQSLC